MYRSPIVGQQRAVASDLGFYADIRFDPDDSQPDFIGLNLSNGAAGSASDWKVYKFSYTGTAVTRIQLAYGAWDDRVSLFP